MTISKKLCKIASGEINDPEFLCQLAERIEYVGEPAFLGLVAARMNQVLEHGFDAAHDDEHTRGELALAAACYALATTDCPDKGLVHNSLWPFEREWWKPKGRRRNLEVAAGLIIAELNRLQRIDERTP